ncbi:MAG TPA: polysaccharide biosynthesis/export family protein [Vicinamibacteria bacterium]|nr:polysaccharide biosynthesis/export family protein [Vicinamibacteria bacterium]
MKARAPKWDEVAALTLGVVTLAGSGRVASAQERPAHPTPPAPSSGYTIGPADVLQITVWKEPDLTRDVTVRFDGMVTIPLVGDVQAAGRTPGQLADSLAESLKRFIEVPRVTVAVNQPMSAHFFVVGQVTKSGEFPLSGRTTVLQGLALAGGFKEFAKPEGIVIVRQDQTVVPVNYKRIADGKDVSQNVLLAPGDTIVVP